MADRYLLESGAPDGYLLEGGSGVLLMEPILPTVRSSSFSATATGTEPTGTVSGDVLVALVTSDSGAMNTPTGWTKDVDQLWSGASLRCTTWYIKRGASAPVLTWTSAGTVFHVSIWAIKDANQTTVLDAAGTSLDNATTTTPSSPSITTATDGALLLVGIDDYSHRTCTVPATFSQDVNDTANGAATANKTKVTAGASGTAQWTFNSTAESCTVTMAIKPVSTAATHSTSGGLVGSGSAIAGSANHITLHPTSGTLVGPGSTVTGSANHVTVHASSGAIVGSGSTISGSAAHVVVHPSSGAIIGGGSTVAGSSARFRAFPSTGSLVGQGPTLSGTAARFRAFASSGALIGPGSVVSGAANRTHVFSTSGTLVGQGSTINGSANRAASGVTHATSGDLVGQGPILSGTSVHNVPHPSTGALVGQGAVITGSSVHNLLHANTGTLVGQGSSVTGSAARFRLFGTSGSLVGQGAVITGNAARFRQFTSSGNLVSQGSSVAGSANRTHVFSTSGSLIGQGSTVNGSAARVGAAVTHDTSGSLVVGTAVINGTATLTPAVVSHDTSGILVGSGSIMSGTAFLNGIVGLDPGASSRYHHELNKKINSYLDSLEKKSNPKEVITKAKISKVIPAKLAQEALEAINQRTIDAIIDYGYERAKAIQIKAKSDKQQKEDERHKLEQDRIMRQRRSNQQAMLMLFD